MTFPTSLPKSRIASPMQAPALRWGILGSGWIAEQFIASVRAHTRQEIAAVGSRSQDKADAFAQMWEIATAHGSYEALVADPGLDVIYVATPHNMHHEHVLLALGSGKNVLVEKPMALNRAQASEMVALARQKGVFFSEALWTYFLPKFDVLQQVLEVRCARGDQVGLHRLRRVFHGRSPHLRPQAGGRAAAGPRNLSGFAVDQAARRPRPGGWSRASGSERCERTAFGCPLQQGRQSGHDVDHPLRVHSDKCGHCGDRGDCPVRKRVQPAGAFRGDLGGRPVRAALRRASGPAFRGAVLRSGSGRPLHCRGSDGNPIPVASRRRLTQWPPST